VSRVILEENRLDRSGRPLSRSDFEDLRLLFEPETTRRRQRLDWKIAADDDMLHGLPSVPVRQIALNLLLNASSAAPDGGLVSFDAREEGEGLQLVVADDGPGLSEAARARLMTEAPVEPGGGVGLRLVRDLVASLRGSVRCDRSQDRTAITISLPRQKGSPC